MAALAPTYSRQQTDELLALYDPHLFTPRHNRPGLGPGGRGAQSATSVLYGTQAIGGSHESPYHVGKDQHHHRRTASIASSVRSYFAQATRHGGTAGSGLTSRPGSVRSYASKSQQLAPLLCLPSEILLHILDFAFPADPHSRWTSSERNHLLCNLALVHPVLRAWAQAELFGGAPVHLTTDSAIEKLSTLAGQHGTRGHSLASRISHVKVYGRHDTGDGGKALAKLIHQLSGLEELHLEDLDGLELRQFVLHTPLRKLTVTRCGFRSRFRIVAATRPSHLESLSLTRCTGHHDSFSGFSLPDLKHLTIWNVSLPPPSALATLEGSEAFRLLGHEVAPRLQSAVVDEQHFHYMFPLALSGGGHHPRSRLEHLTIVRLSHLPTVLDQMRYRAPASSLRVKSVRTLRLVPTPSFTPGATSAERAMIHFQALVAPFHALPAGETCPTGLDGIETISLDWRYGAWLALSPSTAESAKLADFVSRCEDAGIQVVVEAAPNSGPGAPSEDFYGSTMMGGRRQSGLAWSRNPVDSTTLSRTRSG